MDNIILLAGLGNSQFYDITFYYFEGDNKEIFKVKHWYSTLIIK